MDFAKLDNDLKEMRKRNRSLGLTVSGLIFALLLCLVIILNLIGTERTIVVPPSIDKTFWVTKDHASREYLEQMASFITWLILDVSPASIDWKKDILLNYVAPDEHGAMKSRQEIEAERLKRINASTSFLPQQPSPAAQGMKRPISSRQRGIAFIGGMMEVRSADFFGPYALSPSGHWALGWRDADISAGRGGHRNKGHGTYLLYDVKSDRIAVTGKLERPNNGTVADNGTFTLQDWHFGDGLQGTFMAFTSAGHILHKRRFHANLYNGALSKDGAWAICRTANNPDHDDGNRLTAFDLQQGVELFSIHPRTGWADEYEFFADGSRLTVVYNDLGKFTYDKSGNFLDEEIYENACLTSRNFSISLFAAEALLKIYPTGVDQAHHALSAILTARQVGADDDPGWKAMALKLQGIALEAIGRFGEALAIYDEVLSMNPKIGVKRRADSLRKQLGHS